MGKVTRKSDREETSKPKRKRRKKDLDSIHSKILKAKRKLDNVGKGGSKSRQKRQGPTNICNRLLPRLFAGIYRNGSKGKDIQQEGSENMVVKARLEGNALKLFNGDTPKSKYMAESITHDKAKQSPNKEFVKNSLEWTPCTLEQSPILGKKQGQNQKLRLVKKKGEEEFFKSLDPSKVKKQNAINESKYAVQREDICKRRLFQNDKEQLETADTIQTDIDSLNGNKINIKERELMCLDDNQNTSWNPLDRYVELCARISAENFEVGILENYEPDPLTTTIKKLRQAYTDSYRQQRARDKIKQGLLNLESPAFSVEYQACTYSSDSQLSPVQFEVPKCDDYQALPISLQKGASQKNDVFYTNSAKTGKLTLNEDVTRSDFTSCSSRNCFATCGTDNSVKENRKHSDKQLSNSQTSKLINFCFVNEKKSVRTELRENQNCDSQPLANSRHNKKYLGNVRHMSDNVNLYDQKMIQLDASIFSSDSTTPVQGHLLKKHLCDEPSTKYINDNQSATILDNFWQCNDETADKCNIKNVRRVPTILRRCNNVLISKNRHVNGDHVKGLYERSETNLFNESSINDLAKEFREPEFSNLFGNFPTPTVVNTLFNQKQVTNLQNAPTKKGSEVGVGRDVSLCPCESNQQNASLRFDDLAHPRPFEVPCKADMHIEKLIRQERDVPDAKGHHHLFHSNGNGHRGETSFSHFNMESARQFSQQNSAQGDAYQHIRDVDSVRQNFLVNNTHDQRRNIFFKSVKDRAMPNVPRDVQIDKGAGATCAKIFNKTDVECPKSRICGQTTACHCDERYIYFNAADCSRKCNVSQARPIHEETIQRTMVPETSCETKDYIGGSLPNSMENIQILPLKQKHSPYAYPNMIDSHRALLLSNVTQPIKYLAVKNGASIQKIPVYINDSSVSRFAENLPLKVVTLMDTSAQTKTLLPREITAQMIPLQTSGPQFNDFASRETSNRRFMNVTDVKHLDFTSPILYDPVLQSNTWYASSL